MSLVFLKVLHRIKLFTHEHKPINLSEEKYAEILVNTIKDLGIPANRLHIALLKRAFQENYDLFVTGQNMEILLGLPAVGMAMTAMRFKSFTSRPFNGNLYNTYWINRFSVF